MSVIPSVPWCVAVAIAAAFAAGPAPAPAWDLQQMVHAGRPGRTATTTRAVNASRTTRTMIVSAGPACGPSARLTITNQYGKTVFEGEAPCEPLALAVIAGGYLELSSSVGSYEVSLR